VTVATESRFGKSRNKKYRRREIELSSSTSNPGMICLKPRDSQYNINSRERDDMKRSRRDHRMFDKIRNHYLNGPELCDVPGGSW
jgi:hypothetical protein